MSKSELLDYVVAHPHYLIDPYYKDLADAVKQRCKDLASAIPSNRRGRHG